MHLTDIIARLNGVKSSGEGFTALCPAHDDKNPSLSIGQGRDGRILLKCHAGCDVRDILAELELTTADLQPDKPRSMGQAPKLLTNTYSYRDQCGQLLYQKLRYRTPNGGKTFSIRRPDGRGGWVWDTKGITFVPYNLPEVVKADIVFVAEGEKDCETLRKYGLTATTAPHGAKPGGWKPHYNDWFRNKTVYVIPDNDGVGKTFAVETADALKTVAKSVKLLNLLEAYPELPEKGDTSDLFDIVGGKAAKELLALLVEHTPEYKREATKNEFIALFKTLDQYPEEDAAWLVFEWIPEGQITLLAADGEIGKTTLWCNIITAVSNGTLCILDTFGTQRRPMKVAFLTTEDSIRKKLKRKLRLAGADMHNIIAPDFTADKNGLLRNLKFGTKEMAQFIRHFRPALCVFDPVQGFLPPKLNMGSRNEMRDCLAPLITLGEECGTTFLILCHTNKRKGAYGRDRIADSADLWDISRSVLMAGYADDEGIRYLSNEKNNYVQNQETVLFTIDNDGQVRRCGTTWKRDKDYIIGAELSRSTPKREECKSFILNALDEAGGTIATKELENKARDAGYSFETIKRAKGDLKASGDIEFFQTGGNKDRVWHMHKVSPTALDNDFPTECTEPEKMPFPSEISK